MLQLGCILLSSLLDYDTSHEVKASCWCLCSVCISCFDQLINLKIFFCLGSLSCFLYW